MLKTHRAQRKLGFFVPKNWYQRAGGASPLTLELRSARAEWDRG